MNKNNKKEEYAYPMISRYSGWGEGAVAAHRAGFHTMFAVDTEAHACRCFRLNHPQSPVYHADLTKMTPEQTLTLAKFPNRSAAEQRWTLAKLPITSEWIYLSSPPCELIHDTEKSYPFHPLNLLTLNEPWFIAQMKPAVFVLECSASLYTRRMDIVKSILLREVKEHLHEYRVIESVLSCEHYGTYMDRYVMMGVREDIGWFPSFPLPSIDSADWKYMGSQMNTYERNANSILPPLAFPIFEGLKNKLQYRGEFPCLKEHLLSITDETNPYSLTWKPDSSLPVLPNLMALSQLHSVPVPLF